MELTEVVVFLYMKMWTAYIISLNDAMLYRLNTWLEYCRAVKTEQYKIDRKIGWRTPINRFTIVNGVIRWLQNCWYEKRKCRKIKIISSFEIVQCTHCSFAFQQSGLKNCDSFHWNGTKSSDFNFPFTMVIWSLREWKSIIKSIQPHSRLLNPSDLFNLHHNTNTFNIYISVRN